MKSPISREIIKKALIVSASAFVFSIVLSYGIFAFTPTAWVDFFADTPSVGPADNTLPPLHEGAAAQTKEGQLRLGTNLTLPATPVPLWMGNDTSGNGIIEQNELDVGLSMGNDEFPENGIIDASELNNIVNVQHPVAGQDLATCGYVNQVLLSLTLNDCQ